MTDSTGNALKPCPFCGGKAEIWRAQQERTAWIGCMGRCSVLVSKEYKTDAEAIAAWNRRADLAPTPLDARVAALRDAAENLLDAITAEDQFGDRSLTITGRTQNLKWLLEAEEEARAALAAFDTTGGKDE